MSTRSSIAIKNSNGTVRAIYCHYDGYPEGVGMTLVEYWNDEAKINEMLDLGDLSYLGEHIGTKRPFENPYKRGTPEHKEYLEFYETACLFYGRDREEEGIDAVTFGSTTEWMNRYRKSWCEYFYLYENGIWKCYNHNFEEIAIGPEM